MGRWREWVHACVLMHASGARQLTPTNMLSVVAAGGGGIKPCVSSFGGDQFKETSARERWVTAWTRV